MTDYYELLGVDKNASKEEIKEAYEKQVKNIKEEVVNEKRLKQFLKTFDEAYEALNSMEKNILKDENATLIINPQEVQKELEDNNKSPNYLNVNDYKRKDRRAGGRNETFTKDGVLKKEDKKNKLNGEKEKKGRSQKIAEKKSKNNNKSVLNLLMLPFKILALPVIAVLSVIILLLQIINIISWIATKILIVGSISAGAIHLYQVKLGQPINYNILILAGLVLLTSFFLPYILKFVLKILQKINDTLKGFVRGK
ncbi:DnaJ domain-containing protein [Clostridium sp. BL-8]|uniref:DnaJ domain-containing protein n=1 Tax=Clostridium sp. BL-8 TaxID=349938 RepID=UPI00098BFDB8|nr:DnaJ domain-containing protein [Clostridium sp. BL-8]OOM81411.1 chaperone protein DnaJ [Clostridium sp. BL-8]